MKKTILLFLLTLIISCDNSKSEFVEQYFNGDYGKFETELSDSYSGNFDHMKSSYESAAKEIDSINKVQENANLSKTPEKVSATAEILAKDNNGLTTVWSVPGEYGRMVWEAKNNDPIEIIGSENFNQKTDYDYVKIKLLNHPGIQGYVYKYHIKNYKKK